MPGAQRHTDDTDVGEAVDLDALADRLTAEAGGHRAQRAAQTLPHPVDGLRQTVIALVRGQELAAHESPGPASLQVLRGTVQLVSDGRSETLRAAQISPIPDRRHSLHADEDSVVLLSVAAPQRAADPRRSRPDQGSSSTTFPSMSSSASAPESSASRTTAAASPPL